jgi:hypothetical protein
MRLSIPGKSQPKNDPARAVAPKAKMFRGGDWAARCRSLKPSSPCWTCASKAPLPYGPRKRRGREQWPCAVLPVRSSSLARKRAVGMAIWPRGKPDALLHHSDCGSQSGLKRSSQHLNKGGCDGHREASITRFWASAGSVPGAIPTAPGRKARVAELAVRFTPVALRKPEHAGQDLTARVTLTAVDVRETTRPADGAPVRWRLLTTYDVRSIDPARKVIDLYRMRWTIEEYFRTLKTAGFDIEDADLSNPRAPRIKNGPALAGHGAEAVRDAVTRTIITLPGELRRSLTWDQGAEMAQHDRIKIDAGVQDLLLRSAKPMAAWHQREHQRNTTAVLPERHRLKHP